MNAGRAIKSVSRKQAFRRGGKSGFRRETEVNALGRSEMQSRARDFVLRVGLENYIDLHWHRPPPDD